MKINCRLVRVAQLYSNFKHIDEIEKPILHGKLCIKEMDSQLYFEDRTGLIPTIFLNPTKDLFRNDQVITLIDWECIDSQYLEVKEFNLSSIEFAWSFNFSIITPAPIIAQIRQESQNKIEGLISVYGTVISKSVIINCKNSLLFTIKVECERQNRTFSSIITFKSIKSYTRDFLQQFYTININQTYQFLNMKPVKLKLSITGDSVYTLLFDLQQSAQLQSDQNIPININDSHGEFFTENTIELSQSNVNDIGGDQIISYQGVITAILNPDLGLIEIDHKHKLNLAYFRLSKYSGFRVGATLDMSNIHIILLPNCDFFYMLPCLYSTINILRFSTNVNAAYFSNKCTHTALKGFNFFDWTFRLKIDSRLDSLQRLTQNYKINLANSTDIMNFYGFQKFVLDVQASIYEHTKKCLLTKDRYRIPEFIDLKIIRKVMREKSSNLEIKFNHIFLLITAEMTKSGFYLLKDETGDIEAVLDNSCDFLDCLYPSIYVLSCFKIIMESKPYLLISKSDCLQVSTMSKFSKGFPHNANESYKFMVKRKRLPMVKFDLIDFNDLSNINQKISAVVEGILYSETNEKYAFIQFAGNDVKIRNLMQKDAEYILYIPSEYINQTCEEAVIYWAKGCLIEDLYSRMPTKLNTSVYLPVKEVLNYRNVKDTLVCLKGYVRTIQVSPQTTESRETCLRIHLADSLHSEEYLAIFIPNSLIICGVTTSNCFLFFNDLEISVDVDGNLIGLVLPTSEINIDCGISDKTHPIATQEKVEYVSCAALLEEGCIKNHLSYWVYVWIKEIAEVMFTLVCSNCGIRASKSACINCLNSEKNISSRATVIVSDATLTLEIIIADTNQVSKLLNINEYKMNKLRNYLVDTPQNRILLSYYQKDDIPNTAIHSFLDRICKDKSINRNAHIKVGSFASYAEAALSSKFPTSVRNLKMLKPRHFIALDGVQYPSLSLKTIRVYSKSIKFSSVLSDINALLQ